MKVEQTETEQKAWNKKNQKIADNWELTGSNTNKFTNTWKCKTRTRTQERNRKQNLKKQNETKAPKKKNLCRIHQNEEMKFWIPRKHPVSRIEDFVSVSHSFHIFQKQHKWKSRARKWTYEHRQQTHHQTLKLQQFSIQNKPIFKTEKEKP